MDDACEQTSAQLQQGGGQQKQDFEVVLSFSSSFSVLEFSTNKNVILFNIATYLYVKKYLCTEEHTIIWRKCSKNNIMDVILNNCCSFYPQMRNIQD